MHPAAVRRRTLGLGPQVPLPERLAPGASASRSGAEVAESPCRKSSREAADHEGRRLPPQRLRHRWTSRTGARWLIERARAASDAGLDSLFVGDHHNVPVPYYQNVPMLGRLLAEWDDRPAGALFLLPLWHPVLLAEQIGTLASIAAGPFVMQCALGGGAEQFDALGVSMRTRPSRFEAVARHRAPPLRGRRGRHRDAVPRSRGRASRRSRPQPLEVWIGARGAACGRPRRAPRRRVPDRSRSNADRGGRARRRATARPARATAATPDPIAVRRDVHVGADDADARRVAGPILDRGYRGFDPAAPVVGGPDRVAAAFADLGARGLHRRDHPPSRRRPRRSARFVRTAGRRCGAAVRSRSDR